MKRLLAPWFLLISDSRCRVMGIARVDHQLRATTSELFPSPHPAALFRGLSGVFRFVRWNRLPAALPLRSVLQFLKTLSQPYFWGEH